jgi:hypothetical protein
MSFEGLGSGYGYGQGPSTIGTLGTGVTPSGPRLNRIIHSLERGWNPQVTEPGPPPLSWRNSAQQHSQHQPSSSFSTQQENLKLLILQNKLPSMTEIKSLPTRTTILPLHSSSSAPLPLTASSSAGGVGGGGGVASSIPPSSAYDSIVTTLGFQHHQGTDKKIELLILKLILKRETMVQELYNRCNPNESHTGPGVGIHPTSNASPTLADPNSGPRGKSRRGSRGNGATPESDATNTSTPTPSAQASATSILDLMTKLRAHTIELIESICLWRTTSVSYDPDLPRPFMYENKNYLLKLIHDLNFLADITFLTNILNVSCETMKENPLMLPEILSIEKLKHLPESWAKKDTEGEVDTIQFQERLRLRKIERILLQEMEFNSHGAHSTSTVWKSHEEGDGDGHDFHGHTETHSPQTHSAPSTAASGGRPDTTTGGGGGGSDNDHQIEYRKRCLLDWYGVARQQMFKLEIAQNEQLNVDLVSTKRLHIPRHNPKPVSPVAVERTKYATSPPTYVEPIKLYDLISDQVYEEYGREIFQPTGQVLNLLHFSLSLSLPVSLSLSLSPCLSLPVSLSLSLSLSPCLAISASLSSLVASLTLRASPLSGFLSQKIFEESQSKTSPLLTSPSLFSCHQSTSQCCSYGPLL